MAWTKRSSGNRPLMSISKKRAPKVDSDNMERVIQEVYKDINEIIDSVNSGNPSEARKESSGKRGDLRLSKRSDGNYEIQGRTDEGWISSSGRKIKEVDAITSYSSHSSGSTAVLSNASTDLNTTTAALKTLRDEVATLRIRFNESLKTNLSFTTKDEKK